MPYGFCCIVLPQFLVRHVQILLSRLQVSELGHQHASDDIVGWPVAKIGDRWAALEPIRAGARLAFGAFAKDVARGLTVRSDWGPQYIADAFGNELAWLVITHSHAFVREP